VLRCSARPPRHLFQVFLPPLLSILFREFREGHCTHVAVPRPGISPDRRGIMAESFDERSLSLSPPCVDILVTCQWRHLRGHNWQRDELACVCREVPPQLSETHLGLGGPPAELAHPVDDGTRCTVTRPPPNFNAAAAAAGSKQSASSQGYGCGQLYFPYTRIGW
jgi:hypothetical protein